MDRVAARGLPQKPQRGEIQAVVQTHALFAFVCTFSSFCIYEDVDGRSY
jgi:hypothetical protein